MLVDLFFNSYWDGVQLFNDFNRLACFTFEEGLMGSMGFTSGYRMRALQIKCQPSLC